MNRMPRPAISIVVPAFNEARIVGETVRRLDRYFDETGLGYEIIVVDDGSTDETADVGSMRTQPSRSIHTSTHACASAWRTMSSREIGFTSPPW